MDKFYINPDITKAETLPANFYKSEEVVAKLKEQGINKNDLTRERIPFRFTRELLK